MQSHALFLKCLLPQDSESCAYVDLREQLKSHIYFWTLEFVIQFIVLST